MFFANIVWPAIYIVDKMTPWSVVLPSVFIEAFFFGKAFCSGSFARGLALSVFANAITTLCGLAAITKITAILPTIAHDLIARATFGGGTFAPTGWACNILWCAAFNIFVEYWTAKLAAKKIMYRRGGFEPSKNALLWVACGNIITLAIALLLPLVKFLPVRKG